MPLGRDKPHRPAYVEPVRGGKKWANPIPPPWPPATKAPDLKWFLMACQKPIGGNLFLIAWKARNAKDARETFETWLDAKHRVIDCDFDYDEAEGLPGSPGFTFVPIVWISRFDVLPFTDDDGKPLSHGD